MRRVDISGQRFGRLIAVDESPIRKSGKIMWNCICDCGEKTLVDGVALRRGNTRSCGCGRSDAAAERSFKHGGVGSAAYSVWESMKKRCMCESDKNYARYGGAGITICNRWLDFKNFHQDMGVRPPGAWIDRIDNSKGYEPGNCRWATPKEQQRNRTNNKIITFNGVSKPQSQWAEEYGIADNTLSRRLKRGWSVERALTTQRKP